MASPAGTLNKSSDTNGGVKAAIRRPALKLQSDQRLAKLGEPGFQAIADRYRAPLTKHAAAIVGNDRAQAVVERAVTQARGLYSKDARASEPGPWLYWMTHNMAIAEHNREAGRNGSTNGSANGSTNGAQNGAAATAVATNGSSNDAQNGAANGAAGALTTLTFTEGAQQFTHDSETRKLTSSTRVRVRNGVGQLVPAPLLRETATQTQTGGAKPSTGSAGPGAAPHGRRTTLIFFGICALVLAAVFVLDRINNVDADELTPQGLPGQIPGTITPQGTAPGTPPTGQIPPNDTGTVPGLGADGSTTPGSPATPTTPGAPATGSSTPDSTTLPPASGTTTTPPANGTTTPPPASGTTTPPASTTGSEQQGFAALLGLFGVDSAVAQTNPLLTAMSFFGLGPASTPTPKPTKARKAPKLPKPSGTVPPPVTSPTPPSPSPSPPVTPVKPAPTPLGDAGPTITYKAGKGQENDVTIRRSKGRFTIRDGGVSTLPVNTGCRSTGSTSEICKSSGVSRFDVNLGDKDDVMDLKKVGTPVTIAGGKGDDTITGGKGSDTLDGGAGSDRLEGVNGADTLTGGKDDDSLEGGKGNDVLNGETGNDSITGGAGTDSVEAGDGDDSVDVRDDKADRVNCGEGNDSVVADAADVIASDCESISKF